MKLQICFPVFIAVFTIIAVQAQDFSKNLDQFLSEKIPSDQPGLAVLVWKNGSVSYAKGFGRERLDSPVQISPSTTFRMASVSKQFTAMSILLLEKEKKLTFDDKLSRFFPELRPVLSEKITLRHLLTHTSGIPDYESLMDSTWHRQIMDADIVALLKNQSNTYFEPGTKFRYSNTAFCLLAMVTERVSGLPYREFMQNNIFRRLGMQATFLYDAQHPLASRSLGYARNRDGKLVESDQSVTSATMGDGCVYTSLNDYLIWYKALKNNTLVNLGQKLREVGYQFPKHNENGYGLGWFYALNGGGLELMHTGSTCGFSNLVIQAPERDILIVCFSNIADNHEISKDVVKIIQQDNRFGLKMNWWELHTLTN